MMSQNIYIEIEHEIKHTPIEYLPTLLNIIHAFRTGIYPNTVTKGLEILPSNSQSIDAITESQFDDLFGIVKTKHSVSLEEIELAITKQGLERFNDCN